MQNLDNPEILIQVNSELIDAMGNTIPKGSVIEFRPHISGELKNIEVACHILHYRSKQDRNEGKMPLFFLEYKTEVQDKNGDQKQVLQSGEIISAKSISAVSSEEKIASLLIPKLATRFTLDEAVFKLN